ncbi:MAG: hypothetical protein HY851_00150 [candidate division Zixibacteria bacterium]|nr:hypothetical protein [candidate division Zixibacteria bacterium]
MAPAHLFESHRSTAYFERTSTLYVNSGYRYIDPSGSGYRITVGSQLAIRALGHEELFGDLSTSFWYRKGNVRLTGMFGGLVRVTEPNVGSDRLRLNVGMAADVDLGGFQPGVHVRIPVDNNVTNGIKPTFGLHMAYLFQSSQK